jgi:hypothetical protein
MACTSPHHIPFLPSHTCIYFHKVCVWVSFGSCSPSIGVHLHETINMLVSLTQMSTNIQSRIGNFADSDAFAGSRSSQNLHRKGLCAYTEDVLNIITIVNMK